MKMKVINFKSVSPLFEMERDGIKSFTHRLVDPKDKRFRALSQWQPSYNWSIKITNSDTGESFVREILVVDWLRYRHWEEKWSIVNYKWRMIIFREENN